MKYIKSALIALSAFFATSCQPDKTGLPIPNPNNPQINGKWYLKSEIVQVTSPYYNSLDTVTTWTDNDYYQFNSDNTAVYSSSADNISYSTHYNVKDNPAGLLLTVGTNKGASYYNTFNVLALTSSSLTLYYSTTETSGETWYHTLYYTH